MEKLEYLTREECIEKLVNECRFYKEEGVWHVTSNSIGMYNNKLRILLQNSIKFYTSFLPSDTKSNIRLYYFINNITTIIDNTCKMCGNPTTFKKFYLGYHIYCSVKCMSNDPEIKANRESTNFSRYGVAHTLQCKEIREKGDITIKEIYGVEFISQSPIIKHKKKVTSFTRYGYEHTLQVPSIRQEIKETCNVLYGGNAPTSSPEVVAKREEKYFLKTGYKNPANNPEVKKLKKLNCNLKHNVDHYSKTPEFSSQMKEAWKNFPFEKLEIISKKKIYAHSIKSKAEKNRVVKLGQNTYFNKTGYFHNTHNPNSLVYKNNVKSKQHPSYENIYYQSLDEKWFLDLIDNCNLNHCIDRGVSIQYKNIKSRYYQIDFILDLKEEKYLIEIKGPHQYFLTDLINGNLFSKWEAALSYCQKNNYEDYIFILNKQIVSREYIINEYLIPYFNRNYPFL